MRSSRIATAAARTFHCILVVICLHAVQRTLFGGDQLLIDPDEAILWAPAGDFAIELARIVPQTISPFTAIEPKPGVSRSTQSASVELAELREALAPFPASQKDPTIDAYIRARSAIDVLKGNEFDHLQGYHVSPPATGDRLRIELPVLPGMSDEFAEHLRALADYYCGHASDARDRWAKLLDRPEDHRQRRTIWAAYMIGKSWLEEDGSADGKGNASANAIAEFQKVRALAHDGYPDPLGLAASSFGWEALAELRLHHANQAAHLYMKAFGARDHLACESLALMCHDWLATPEGLPVEVSSDTLTARIVTAYVVAEGTKFFSTPKPDVVRSWIKRVAPNEREIGADRLGWAAYQIGDDVVASRLLAMAPPREPMSLWIRAKLAVKAGKPDDAEQLFTDAIGEWPKDDVWHETRSGLRDSKRSGQWMPYRIGGELAALQLSRGRYIQALEAMLAAKRQQEAAYIAECVLTCDELSKYVDGKSAALAIPAAASPSGPDELGSTIPRIRNILARRLTRDGRWKEAASRFDDKADVQLLAEYVKAIRAGHDRDSSDDDRARSFWQAALIAHEHGVALFGHDTYPEDRSIVYFRLSVTHRGGLGASDDERKRVAAVAHRFSSVEARQIAAGHAWEAARLMPDESDETARVLCIAGNWAITENPDTQMKIYRALVDRCGTTRLGREAAKLNRLPPASSAKR